MMMERWLVRVSSHPRLQISYGSICSWASIGCALFNLALVPAQSEKRGEALPRQRLRDMPFRAILNYWIVGRILFEVLCQIPRGWRPRGWRAVLGLWWTQ